MKRAGLCFLGTGPLPSILLASVALRCGLPAPREAMSHCRSGQIELTPEMGAIGKQRCNRRLCVPIMPGKGGAYGIPLIFDRLSRRFILGKRSHVSILLWGHSHL
jgi:hypothetical protein